MLPDLLLPAGVLLWALTHLSISVTPGVRESLITGMGENLYKGLFSLVLVGAIVLMVMGWKDSSPVLLYALPAGVKLVTMALMWVALILFICARAPNDFKRILRHPQLTAVIVWAFAHLLSNGDSRSLFLFGGLGLWAILEIIFINRREGVWQKSEPVGVVRNLITVVIGTVLFLVVAYAHPWLAGIAIVPAH